MRVIAPFDWRKKVKPTASMATMLVAIVGVVVLVPDPFRGPLTIVLIGSLLAGLSALFHKLAQLGTILLTLSVVTATHTALRLTQNVSFSDVFLVLSAGLLIPTALCRRRFWVTGQVLLFLVGVGLIFAGGLLGSTVAADSITRSLAGLSKFLIAMLLVPMVFWAWKPTENQLIMVSWSWVAGVVVNVLVGVAEIQSTYLGRVDGLALHPNTLGLAAVFAVGPACALGLNGGKLAKWAGFAAILLLGCGVLISGSRAALGGFAISIALFVVITRQFRLLIGLGIVGVISLGFLASPLVELPEGNALARLRAVSDPSSALDVANSNSGREELLAHAIEEWGRHPLTGIGFEDAVAAHNLIVQVGSSGGPLALLGYFLVMAGLLVPIGWSMVNAKYLSDNRALVFLVGYGCSIIGFLAGAFFHNSLWERYLWFVPAMTIVVTPPVFPSVPKSRTSEDVSHRATGRRSS